MKSNTQLRKLAREQIVHKGEGAYYSCAEELYLTEAEWDVYIKLVIADLDRVRKFLKVQ